MNDIVERLRECRDPLRAWGTMEEAADEIERLTAALRPFADYADAKSKMPGDYVITSGSALAKRQLTMADCYAARAALEGKP